MRERQAEKSVTPDYERFKAQIQGILRKAKQPMTWAEIKEAGGFRQKVPNNKWVKWMEEDIDLIREKTREGRTAWKLK
jgi:hypothetical protein